MSLWKIQEAVDHAIQDLPGFDADERQWVRSKVLRYLAGAAAPDPVDIPSLVCQWAGLLSRLEQPVREGELESAISIALDMHGGLTRETGLFCRHLVREADATGKTEFNTVGEVADFILFALIALEDGTIDLSTLHDIADQRAGHVALVLAQTGEPEPTAQENAWLHGTIFEDFARPEFSPFSANRSTWYHHVTALAERLRSRRALI